ncbi:MAG: type II toxin-antitoxin system VapC family toxin [Deltaproteobacteria bacterium]|nr:type II toxin-antitoxin system VapC family toxin [Deltaproteobacteria bacterium]
MFLLDTCSFLWMTMDPRGLSEQARAILAPREQEIFVSAISAFEIGIKVQKGKLQLSLPPSRWFKEALQLHDLQEIALKGEIAAISTELPLIHADPFDRILIATAIEHRLTILTPDPLIQKYPDVKWAW